MQKVYNQATLALFLRISHKAVLNSGKCLHEEEGQQVLLAKKRGSRLNKFKKPLRVKQIFCQ